MICFKCQTENPATRKFCRECGAKLLLVCPQCGTENLPDDKFCGECGYDLRKPKETPPIYFNQPQSYPSNINEPSGLNILVSDFETTPNEWR